MSNSFFAGLEAFMDENPVEATATVTVQPENAEEEIEKQQDLADASQDLDEADHAVEKTEEMLSRIGAMYDYVQKNGVDRTFLAMFNSDGELSKLIKREIPSCEAFNAENGADISKICCEGFAEVLKRGFLGLRDDIVKGSTAFRRAIQSLMSDAKSCKEKLSSLKEQVKSVKEIPESSVKGYTKDDFKKWTAIDPAKLRDNALSALHTIQSWTFSDALTPEATKLADELEEDIEKIEKAEPEKQSLSIKTWSKADLLSAIDYSIKACDSIIKANDQYEGFWKTGFNQGKLQALADLTLIAKNPVVAGLSGGITALRQNVIRIARTSWRNMNTLSSIDDKVIHAVIRMSQTAVKQ